MNILVTGATGFIGSAACQALEAATHRVVQLHRGAGPGPTWNPAAQQIDLSAMPPLDAVIHLAGENVGHRWTAGRKRRIRESRVQGTRLLADALAKLTPPPRVLICASATGYYGNRADEWLDESSPSGAGFLAEVCREWEAAAAPAAAAGIRVVQLRFGLVLARHGGALARMLPPFRLGLGGRLGGGRQYWSWLALDDAVAAVLHALKDDTLHGPVNTVSPQPATNRDFTRALARALHRPAFFAVPRFAVNLLFGEMGREALLSSCRARPAKLLAAGFAFRHPELEPLLRHLLG